MFDLFRNVRDQLPRTEEGLCGSGRSILYWSLGGRSSSVLVDGAE
jgi:hypothetical protein